MSRSWGGELHRVLIVSPHFPPVNRPDMQRVRLCAPHLPGFGWEPLILAVRPDAVAAPQDPLLLETVPASTEVFRVPAFPYRWSRTFGIGDLGLRSLVPLYRRGNRLLEQRKIDLVYFSTTVFTTLVLGRLWKRRFRVPYVFDMQDPWVADPATTVGRRSGWKRRLAMGLHRTLEPWAIREVDGLIAVSEAYVETLKHRYSRLRRIPALTLPFGCSQDDFDLLQTRPQGNRFFNPKQPGRLNGVYVGRGGDDMRTALEILFGAFKRGLEQHPAKFGPIRLYFIGTDYAPPPRGRFTVKPVAERFGLDGRVVENPARVPYFEALKLLSDSDFLVVVGSTDPGYSASKVYPYVLARKPMLALFHQSSSVVDFVRRTGCGRVAPFGSGADEGITPTLESWLQVLGQIGHAPGTNWDEFSRYGAEELARQHCRFFEEVLRARNTEKKLQKTPRSRQPRPGQREAAPEAPKVVVRRTERG